ncbi:MAG TPA: hypothetical protein P5550_07435 [Bacteroidales bacterium]|nr:hypothetical protein [Bacteroidales bacterium]HRZ75794.1 hypothetical protein [Bacteroidales bacterium]
MAPSSARFSKQLLVFTLITGLAGFMLWLALPLAWRSPVYPYLVVFFFASTLLMHRLLFVKTGERLVRFINRYMMVTTLKIIAFLGIILIYALLVNPSDAIPFTVTFFVLYVAFTLFELLQLLRAGRQNGAGEE